MTTPLPDPPPMFTVPQVAHREVVDRDTVVGWIKSGALRAINVGRGRQKPRYRIPPEALEEFERSRTIGTPPPKTKRRWKKRDPEVIEFF